MNLDDRINESLEAATVAHCTVHAALRASTAIYDARYRGASNEQITTLVSAACDAWSAALNAVEHADYTAAWVTQKTPSEAGRDAAKMLMKMAEDAKNPTTHESDR